MQTLDQVKEAFLPVDPKKVSEQQKQGIIHVQQAFIELASQVLTDVPQCKERDQVLNDLLAAKFLCVQAITHVGYLTPEERQKNVEAAKKAFPNIVTGPVKKG